MAPFSIASRRVGFNHREHNNFKIGSSWRDGGEVGRWEGGRISVAFRKRGIGVLRFAPRFQRCANKDDSANAAREEEEQYLGRPSESIEQHGKAQNVAEHLLISKESEADPRREALLGYLRRPVLLDDFLVCDWWRQYLTEHFASKIRAVVRPLQFGSELNEKRDKNRNWVDAPVPGGIHW